MNRQHDDADIDALAEWIMTRHDRNILAEL